MPVCLCAFELDFDLAHGTVGTRLVDEKHRTILFIANNFFDAAFIVDTEQYFTPGQLVGFFGCS